MKRSSKVVLLFMGTAAGALSAESALARSGCHNSPDPPGFASPGIPDNAPRCTRRSGFGSFSHGFSHHFHGHGHGHGG
jgi:hypothetical protein